MSTYLPIPYSHNLIQGVPDLALPLLMPTLQLEDGQQLAPLCWFQQIEVQEEEKSTILKWQLPYLAVDKAKNPRKEQKITAEVTLRFSPGKIIASYVISPGTVLEQATIAMDWIEPYEEQCLSLPADQQALPFKEKKSSLNVQGFDRLVELPVEQQSVTGSLPKAHLRFIRNIESLEATVLLQWELSFKG